MKKFGICLMITGVVWCFYAFNMKTSIETDSRVIGSGPYSVYVPSQSVHNLDLADQKRNHLIGAGIVTIVGAILFGFGSLQKQTVNNSPNITTALPKIINPAVKIILVVAVIFGTLKLIELIMLK
ncbi:MAG: hypothetical protein HYV06_07880 [Deltaproteobacteria bacterium]|nr:hypothetical protein [Deltaproteobacteria bacterium]